MLGLNSVCVALADSGAIAKDPKTPEKEKEACLAFVDAEGKLDKEDCIVGTCFTSKSKCYCWFSCGHHKRCWWAVQDVDGCLSLSKTAVQKFEAPRKSELHYRRYKMQDVTK